MAGKKEQRKEKETSIDRRIKKMAPFIIGLVVLALVFVALYILFRGLGEIEYNGLTFRKEKFGELIFYHYNYLTKTSSGSIRSIDIYMRINPAENKVPVEGKIVYPAGKKVYISINNTGLNECEYSIIALAELSQFLVANNIVAKAGTPDKEEAEQKNLTFADCEKFPSNAVILLESGEKTEIINNKQCYNIRVSTCEILPAVEKFIIQSIIDAKEG